MHFTSAALEKENQITDMSMLHAAHSTPAKLILHNLRRFFKTQEAFYAIQYV